MNHHVLQVFLVFILFSLCAPKTPLTGVVCPSVRGVWVHDRPLLLEETFPDTLWLRTPRPDLPPLYAPGECERLQLQAPFSAPLGYVESGLASAEECPATHTCTFVRQSGHVKLNKATAALARMVIFRDPSPPSMETTFSTRATAVKEGCIKAQTKHPP